MTDRFVLRTNADGTTKIHMLGTRPGRHTSTVGLLCSGGHIKDTDTHLERPDTDATPCGQCLASFRMFVRRQGREYGGLTSHSNNPTRRHQAASPIMPDRRSGSLPSDPSGSLHDDPPTLWKTS